MEEEFPMLEDINVHSLKITKRLKLRVESVEELNEAGKVIRVERTNHKDFREELDQARQHIKVLKREIERKDKAAHRRNQQLAALYFAWGTNPTRYAGELSEELVSEAEANASRLRSMLNNIEWKAKYTQLCELANAVGIATTKELWQTDIGGRSVFEAIWRDHEIDGALAFMEAKHGNH